MGIISRRKRVVSLYLARMMSLWVGRRSPECALLRRIHGRVRRAVERRRELGRILQRHVYTRLGGRMVTVGELIFERFRCAFTA